MTIVECFCSLNMNIKSMKVSIVIKACVLLSFNWILLNVCQKSRHLWTLPVGRIERCRSHWDTINGRLLWLRVKREQQAGCSPVCRGHRHFSSDSHSVSLPVDTGRWMNFRFDLHLKWLNFRHIHFDTSSCASAWGCPQNYEETQTLFHFSKQTPITRIRLR